MKKKVREVLRQHGWMFHHHGRGDHDVWTEESTGKKKNLTTDHANHTDFLDANSEFCLCGLRGQWFFPNYE